MKTGACFKAAGRVGRQAGSLQNQKQKEARAAWDNGTGVLGGGKEAA